MTVIQGTRPLAGVGTFPRALPGAGARPVAGARRRRLSNPARAGRRAHPVGLLLAITLVALLVGLIYVAQTIHLAATNYEIDRLTAERDDLARQIQTLETNVLRWGTEATVLERAQRIGLDQVAARIRLPAR